MIQALAVYHHLFEIFLLNVGYAYSQQVVMRAGVFSVATAGFAALGAYSAAILVVRFGYPAFVALPVGLLMGTFAAFLLSIPLARLRGVYQAIASLAFVEIIGGLLLFGGDFTGGALGINQIPKSIATWQLLLTIGVLVYLMHAIGSSGINRAFDAIRQDETVAMALGVSVRYYHTLAFLISGAVGGLFGGIHALLAYTIDPSLFGFGFLAMVLAFIVLGGRSTLAGPIIGAAILTALPELARPLAENRQLAQGILMIAMISFFPNGVVDTLLLKIQQRRAARRYRKFEEQADRVLVDA
jgi:branched-chain amino acid transport system permease protein